MMWRQRWDGGCYWSDENLEVLITFSQLLEQPSQRYSNNI